MFQSYRFFADQVLPDWQIEGFAPAKGRVAGGIEENTQRTQSLQILFCLMHMSSCVSLFSVTCKSMESMAHLLPRSKRI